MLIDTAEMEHVERNAPSSLLLAATCRVEPWKRRMDLVHFFQSKWFGSQVLSVNRRSSLNEPTALVIEAVHVKTVIEAVEELHSSL